MINNKILKKIKKYSEYEALNIFRDYLNDINPPFVSGDKELSYTFVIDNCFPQDIQYMFNNSVIQVSDMDLIDNLEDYEYIEIGSDTFIKASDYLNFKK